MSRSTTIDLQQAADLLKLHPHSLQEKAKRGEIPGAKIGRRWVFIEEDLLEYIRSRYAAPGAGKKPGCSVKVREHPTGVGSSAPRDWAYSNLLKLQK